MDQHKYVACEAIDASAQQLYLLSRRIWCYAEPGAQEYKSSETLIRFLKKRNFAITKHLEGLPTAFLAEFGDREFGGCKRPNIAVVCQYDAVRGEGHVTGNNLVCEVAVGVALGLQAAIMAASEKIGKVTLIGCSNSVGGDIVKLINRRVFKPFDLAVGGVPGPRTEWSPVYLGSKTYRVSYTDTEFDLCGNDVMPPAQKHLIDTLGAAVLAQGNLQVMQEQLGRDWRMLGAVQQCDGGFYRPPSLTQSVVRCLAPSDEELAMMEKKVVPCLMAAGQASGCGMEVTLGDKMIHSLHSSPSMVYLLQLNAYRCGLLATPRKPKEILPPADMANVSHLMPTLRPMFYIGKDVEVGTPEFKAAAGTESAHLNAIACAKALAYTALDMMHCPRTLDAARQELHGEVSRQYLNNLSPLPVQQLDKQHQKSDQQRQYPIYRVPKQVPADCLGWSKR